MSFILFMWALAIYNPNYMPLGTRILMRVIRLGCTKFDQTGTCTTVWDG